MTNSERCVTRQRSFLRSPGEARADWWIIAQVARRMGFGDQFAWEGPAAIFREHCALTAFENDGARRLDLTKWADITDDAYENLEAFQWGGERLQFAPGATRLVTVEQPPIHTGGMVLNSGRYRDQWHSMTRTGLSPRLSQHRREPLVDVHPDDARAAGLADGDLARVATAQGDSIFQVAVTDAQRPGEIFVPIHWTDCVASGGRAGLLPSEDVDPVSGQPGFKLTPAQVERVSPDWRAFLLLREVPRDEPGCLWWVKVRVTGGWLYELAGRDGEEAELERLLPHGELLEASDAAQGVRRLVITTASHLHGALFIARNGELPPRDWLIGQLAAQEPAPLFAYLAARSPDRAEVWEPAVCVCFSVGRSAIMAALVDGGARSVGEIGTATRAGTNCGSCKPELTRLLAEWEQSHAA